MLAFRSLHGADEMTPLEAKNSMKPEKSKLINYQGFSCVTILCDRNLITLGGTEQLHIKQWNIFSF